MDSSFPFAAQRQQHRQNDQLLAAAGRPNADRSRRVPSEPEAQKGEEPGKVRDLVLIWLHIEILEASLEWR